MVLLRSSVLAAFGAFGVCPDYIYPLPCPFVRGAKAIQESSQPILFIVVVLSFFPAFPFVMCQKKQIF
jgi:hypothetical protein